MLFVVFGLAARAVVAQAGDSLTGTWVMSVDSAGYKGNPTFVLQQDGEQITGNYQTDKVTGKILGKDFIYTFNNKGLEITYQGKIEGNKVSGTVVFGTYGKGVFTGEKQ